MAVTGPDFVALQVRDLDRAAAFYEARLGLRRIPASPPGAIVFDTTPISFPSASRCLASTWTPRARDPASGWCCGYTPTTHRLCMTRWPQPVFPSRSRRSMDPSAGRSHSAIPTATPSPFMIRPSSDRTRR